MKKILLEMYEDGTKYIYDLVDTANGVILRYSELDKSWTFQNKEFIKFVDTGDNILLTYDDQTISIPFCDINLIGFVIQYMKSKPIKSTMKVLTIQEEKNEF